MGLYIYSSVIFAAGMASKGLRLEKKNKIYFFADILIPDGQF